jgi:hypothetical protein
MFVDKNKLLYLEALHLLLDGVHDFLQLVWRGLKAAMQFKNKILISKNIRIA